MGTEAPLIVAGDRDLLKQLVLNLVDNAIKYFRGEDVFISLLQRDSGAEIVVEDKELEFRRNNWSGSSSAFTRETRRVRAPSAARASASRSASGSQKHTAARSALKAPLARAHGLSSLLSEIPPVAATPQ